MASTQSTRDHVRDLIYAVCCVAGSTLLFNEIEHEDGLRRAIQQHNTPKLFHWLVYAFSFQGIADGIASSYLERHGLPSWLEVEAGLEHASCRKLKSYWSFSDCGYRKGAGACNEPDHFSAGTSSGMGASTRSPMLCFCSSQILLVVTWLLG
jgi:hypothetical protein